MSQSVMRWLPIWACVLLAPGLAHAVEVGAPAPQIGLDDLSGNRIGIAQFRGKVLVVSTWASWCEPCREELPALQAIHRRHRSRGLRVVGINVDRDPEVMRQMVRELGLGFPNVHDPRRNVAMRWGATMMPTIIVVGPDGVVRHVHRSYQPGDERQVEQEVRALLPAPSAPRGSAASGIPSTAPPTDRESAPPAAAASETQRVPRPEASSTDDAEPDDAEPDNPQPNDAEAVSSTQDVDAVREPADELLSSPAGSHPERSTGDRVDGPATSADGPPPASPSAAGRSGGLCATASTSSGDGVLLVVLMAALILTRRRLSERTNST